MTVGLSSLDKPGRWKCARGNTDLSRFLSILLGSILGTRAVHLKVHPPELDAFWVGVVVLAAGVPANLTINPFEAMTTITVKIVNQLTGDLEFNSPQTLVAFALGLTLFFITLAMNIFALYIVRKYREQYE